MGMRDVYQHVHDNKSHYSVYSIFNTVTSRRKSRGKGKNITNDVANDNTKFNADTFTSNLKNIVKDEPKFNVIKKVRTEIFSLKADNCKKLFLYLSERINKGDCFSWDVHDFIHFVLRDMCLHRLQRMYVSKKSYHFISLLYVNKYMDTINMSQIMKKPELKYLFPVKSDAAVPCVTYSYGNTIRNKIVNYKQTIKADNQHFKCHCNKYSDKFVQQDYKHIFTGDLEIVSDPDLRRVMGYGLNYREQQAPDKGKAFTQFQSGVDKYVARMSEKYHKSPLEFVPWKVSLLKALKQQLDTCKSFRYDNVLNKATSHKELNTLLDHFVLVPVDKASNNIAIICKKFYMDTLKQELSSKTFENVPISDQTFNDSCKQFLTTHKIPASYQGNVEYDTPFIYWSAKMHKHPPKFRFITSGTHSILSGLSKMVTKCLKLLLNTARFMDKYRIVGLDHHIAVIDNRSAVIKYLLDSNTCKQKHKTINSWDFENLYTNIPLDKLKCQMKKFVLNIFKLKSPDAKFITINNKRAYWTKTRSKVNVSCSNGVLVEWINFIIDNAYVKYNNMLYHQIVGIPMGTSCAPYLANIFLHVYEHDYLQKLVADNDLETAVKLQNFFRYQDDCLSINDAGTFAEHYNYMYPKELNLKNTNIKKFTCTFLDLTITIYRGKFNFRSFDKRQDFDFNVVKYPHLHGKIPRIPSYGVFMSQLLRFCEINMHAKDFKSDINELFNTFKNQGFNVIKLKGYFHKFCEKYLYKWAKFGCDIAKLNYSHGSLI